MWRRKLSSLVFETGSHYVAQAPASVSGDQGLQAQAALPGWNLKFLKVQLKRLGLPELLLPLHRWLGILFCNPQSNSAIIIYSHAFDLC
jgi:hypothetical protein